MRTDLRSPKVTKAIRHAIREVRLAYEFVPNSYTASAFNAVRAVEQVYLRNADHLDHQHDTNRARTS